MKTNENKPTETEQPENKTQTDVEIIENLVTEYYKKYQESPFKDFQAKDDDQMAVDMDAKFEKSITEIFDDRTSEVLGEYISDLIRNLMENLDENEIEEIKNGNKEA